MPGSLKRWLAKIKDRPRRFGKKRAAELAAHKAPELTIQDAPVDVKSWEPGVAAATPSRGSIKLLAKRNTPSDTLFGGDGNNIQEATEN